MEENVCEVKKVMYSFYPFKRFPWDYVYTVGPKLLHAPSREERRFLDFNHLSIEFLEQMIPHLKALI